MIRLFMVLPIAALPLWFTDLVAVAEGILVLAACVLVLLAIPVAIELRRAIRRAADGTDVISRHLVTDVLPLVRDAATAITTMNEILGTIRRDVDAVHDTVTVASASVRTTVENTQARIERAGALVDLVQDELEDVVGVALGTVARVRLGVASLRGAARVAGWRLLGRIVGVGARKAGALNAKRPRIRSHRHVET
jgi:hypothetical protein